METAPIAGKSWQLSHEPPIQAEGRKPGTRHTDKTVEREGGAEKGKQPLRKVRTLKTTLTLKKNAESTQNLIDRHVARVLTRPSFLSFTH